MKIEILEKSVKPIPMYGPVQSLDFYDSNLYHSANLA